MSSLTLNGFLNSSVARNITEMRGQIADRSQEATTGIQADLVKHLDGRLDQALIGDQAIQANQDDQARLELRKIRLSIQDTTLTAVRDLSEGLQLQMSSVVGLEDVAGQDAVAATAKQALSDILLRMNARHGERFLFSGDATATLPYADVDTLLNDLKAAAATATDATDFATHVHFYFENPAGGFQTSFYQGTATTSDADAVLGNEQAFSDVMQGLAILALANRDEGVVAAQAGSPALDQALDRLERGRTGLVTLQSQVGLRQASLETEQTVLAREETLLSAAFRDLAGKDQYEAATELKDLETNLEASYILTSRLSNLSLLNYLR
jgi:flagellar hook-associated protein 3 FlgL